MKNIYSLIICIALILSAFVWDKQPVLAEGYKDKMADVHASRLAETTGWQVIMNETFEGMWPSSNWSVVDLSSDGNDRKWDDDDYRPHTGSKAVWPARGGANGLDPSLTNHHYFNNMETSMTYGPFDLSNAFKADLSFWLWREIEACCDYLAFEVSRDGVSFDRVSTWRDNNYTWPQQNISLDAYLGDNSVWVAWRFYSDVSNVFDGPWIDDIALRKYTVGQVTPQGFLYYADRKSNWVGASYTKVSLYDQDPGGTDDLLATTTTDANGFFQFQSVTNWDFDDTDPDPNNRRLDLYVVWETDNNDSGIARRRVTNFQNQNYKLSSNTITNVPDGMIDFSSNVPSDVLRAMWIFQDVRHAWEDVRNNTFPQIDPGSVTIKWESFAGCYPDFYPVICTPFFYASTGGPFIFIPDDLVTSSDTVVHETGHNYISNLTGWWWWNPTCWNHNMFTQTDVNCAWSEGWADFFPLVVNNDPCYDFGPGPCGFAGFGFYDLEAHSRYDPPNYPWGDIVEGRVAGSLYDLFDNTNDGFDTASFGFSPIANIVFQGTVEGDYMISGIAGGRVV